MRWVFISFLLLNVLYFGWELDRQTKSDHSNTGLLVNIPVDSQPLRLLAELDSGSYPKPAIKTEPVEIESTAQGQDLTDYEANESKLVIPEPISELVTELPAIDITDLHARSDEVYCFRFGPLPEEILATGLSDWFKSRRASANIRYTDEQGKKLFWIYLTPRQSRSGAMDIILDLRKKGVSDYRLISRGNLQNAISLGLFSSQASVNKRLRELEKKGYKPVVVPYYNGKRIYWVDVKFQVELDLIDEIFKGHPSRYNSVPVNCSKIVMLMPRSQEPVRK